MTLPLPVTKAPGIISRYVFLVYLCSVRNPLIHPFEIPALEIFPRAVKIETNRLKLYLCTQHRTSRNWHEFRVVKPAAALFAGLSYRKTDDSFGCSGKNDRGSASAKRASGGRSVGTIADLYSKA